LETLFSKLPPPPPQKLENFPFVIPKFEAKIEEKETETILPVEIKVER